MFLLVKARLKHKHPPMCALSYCILSISDTSASLPAKALRYWGLVQCIGMVLQDSRIDSHKVLSFRLHSLKSLGIYITIYLLISNSFSVSQVYQQHCSFSILLVELLPLFFQGCHSDVRLPVC